MEDNYKAGPLQDYEDAMDLYTPIMNFVRSGQASYDALPAAISHDLSRAIALLDRAAVEGLPQAIDRLGSVYMTGEGLPRDPERGVALYQAAAEAGDARHEDRHVVQCMWSAKPSSCGLANSRSVHM